MCCGGSSRWTDFVTPDNLLRAWEHMKATRRPYSETVGLTGLEAYALDAAVVRWGNAFEAALRTATAEAKNRNEAENRAGRVLRRWVPSTRQYR